MNILVACEESQRVCMAFREKGHNAFSCDIQDCSGGHPEWHIRGDVLRILNPEEHFSFRGINFRTCDETYHQIHGKWDMIIAFPPCTYLTVNCMFNKVNCYERLDAEQVYNLGYRKASEVAREIDDLRRYIILNEDIALKCKQENGEKNEEYWKGKLSAFKQIRAYIDAELKKKYTEEGK